MITSIIILEKLRSYGNECIRIMLHYDNVSLYYLYHIPIAKTQTLILLNARACTELLFSMGI